MTVIVDLTESVERRLAERAAAAGKTPAAFVVEVVERELAKPRTLAEIMAPVAAEFAASGMTEDELDALVEEAREEVWQEQQKLRAKP